MKLPTSKTNPPGLGALIVTICSCVTYGQPIRPPAQPADGPGGAAHANASVVKNKFDSLGLEYWIFEPAEPTPKSAPVVLFMHGWSATSPGAYGGWIDHLVKRGNIVIFPRYQADIRTPVSEFLPNSILAIQHAFTRLENDPSHVRPELDHCAIVGHSMGGVLAADIGAIAAESKLPVMKAIMCVQPGKTSNNLPAVRIDFEDLKKIPRDTLLIALAGDSDNVVGDHDARRIFNESTSVPAANKNLVILISDAHGRPALLAGHGAACSFDAAYNNDPSATSQSGTTPEMTLRQRLLDRQRRGAANEGTAAPAADGAALVGVGTDALDYFGFWKLFDGLTDAAFFEKNRNFALGDTPEQRFMGKWSDGTPVKELKTIKN